MDKVRMAPDLLVTASQNRGNLPDLCQVVAALCRAHNRFCGAFNHGLKGPQIGFMGENIGRMGKGHDEIKVHEGITNQGGSSDVLKQAAMPAPAVHIQRIKKIRARSVIGPITPQIHCQVPLSVIDGDVPRSTLDRLFYKRFRNPHHPILIHQATGPFQEFNRALMKNLHAHLTEDAKHALVDSPFGLLAQKDQSGSFVDAFHGSAPKSLLSLVLRIIYSCIIELWRVPERRYLKGIPLRSEFENIIFRYGNL
jgi:hypothetical protein